MMADKPRPAFIWELTGENSGRWLEAGTARPDENGGLVLQIDRLPVNPDNFSGYICVPAPDRSPSAANMRACQQLEMADAFPPKG